MHTVAVSQDEHDCHGDREAKSKPRIRRGSEGTFAEQGMTRGNQEGGVG